MVVYAVGIYVHFSCSSLLSLSLSHPTAASQLDDKNTEQKQINKCKIQICIEDAFAIEKNKKKARESYSVWLLLCHLESFCRCCSSFLLFSLHNIALCKQQSSQQEEATAKKRFYSSFSPLLSVVLFVCFLLSISAAFEYQLVSKEYKDDGLCKSNRSQAVVGESVSLSARAHSSRVADNESALNPVKRNDSSYNFNEDERVVSHRRLERSFDNDVLSAGIDDASTDSPKLRHKTSHNPADVDHYVNDAERDNATSTVIPKRHHNICSSVSDFYCRL